LRDQLPAPVHADVVDFDRDGDTDVLVSCMGQVFPNNDKIGSASSSWRTTVARTSPRPCSNTWRG
jgi:hypothetical protein